MAVWTCASCSTENPVQARFCMSCGSALERRCPTCGAVPPPQAKFCMDCGNSLEEGAGDPQPSAPERPALAEERRRVSVLFADLSGFTPLAEKMDPEVVKSLVDGVLRRLGDEVERFGGHVDKYIGDNVMAVFGAPVAHEDDAERAVRAALGMQEAMAEINAGASQRHGVGFALRVGVNTGEVLFGAIGGGQTVIGDAVNVASRLQSAGRPGTVTVGRDTWRATRAAIEYSELEPLTLKGKSEPVPAWEATGFVDEGSGTHTATQSRLIGRDEDLDQLVSLAGRVGRENRPHLATIIGQAGVGKSRLLREFERRSASLDPAPRLRAGRCLPYGQGVVYWALGEIIRTDAGIGPADSAEDAWKKLKGYVGELVVRTEDPSSEAVERNALLIARLLGIDTPDKAPDLGEGLDPQRMRESFFSAVRYGIEAMAGRGPLVLAFEDIHWADDGMLDLIEHLAQWVRGPLLILCLARDELLERRSDWGSGRRSATQIVLEPLTDEQTHELVMELLPDLSSAAAPLIAQRAGGNPLFAEEMALLVADSDGETETLPESVQALLAARLDSLEPRERRVLQQASVLGQTFGAGSLSAVAEEEGSALEGTLTTLQEKDLVILGPGTPTGEREYAFKHVLIRDVAYGMLPKAVRAKKHFEVGTYLEERAGDRGEEVVALLAEHYGRAAQSGREAGLGPEELSPIQGKALHFFEAAGDAAASLYSNAEALRQYESARELTGTHDPAGLARIGEREGDVAVRMGRVDQAIAIWEECLEYHRTQEDLERMGDLHRRIGAGLWHKGERREAIEHYQKGINLLKDGPPCLELVRLYEEAAWLYMHTGDNMLAIYASEKALRLSERLGETRAASRAHGIFGRVFGRIGDTAKARENLERSVEIARGSDRGETVRALLTLGNHLELGEADYPGAKLAYDEGLQLAERLGDVPAQVDLFLALAQLAVYRADWESVSCLTAASAELAEREGLAGKMALPLGLRGILAWREGNWDEAERLLRAAHAQADQVGWSEVSVLALYGLA
ncbi:MAG: AAA family ATPase, partial [Thermoleophilaceae bacterium]|nr:AAA family ATPase [Thermoleophilaceae bacterium]